MIRLIGAFCGGLILAGPAAAVPSVHHIVVAPGYDASAQAIFAAMVTPPTPARKALINRTVGALKAAGVWGRLDVLYVLAAADEQAARLNWKAPGAYAASVLGVPSFTADLGWNANGLGYLDTGFNPDTAGGLFSQDSASISIGTRSTIAEAGAAIMAGNARSTIQTRSSGDNFAARPNATAGSIMAATGNGVPGLFSWSRDNAADFTAHRRGAAVGGIIAKESEPLTSANFLIGTADGSTLSAKRIDAFAVGGALSAAQRVAFWTAYQVYMTSLGLVP